MDFKEIKRLISLVEEAQISAFRIDTGAMKIEIEKQFAVSGAPVIHHSVAPSHAAMPAPAQAATPANAEPAEDSTPKLTIKSPMVGTFYAASGPDAAPYVSVGDTVSKGQVVCMVEAMKLFNEIESEVSGTIEKVLVASGDPVEYGQDLFVLKP